MLAVRLVAAARFPGLTYFAGSFVAAALWPTASLSAPLAAAQAAGIDENRPI